MKKLYMKYLVLKMEDRIDLPKLWKELRRLKTRPRKPRIIEIAEIIINSIEPEVK